jgi:hypothetical protein
MVQEKIKEREPQLFEQRILRSIQTTFDKANYKIDDIKFSQDKYWHADLATIAKQVELLDYTKLCIEPEVGRSMVHGTI